MEHSSWRCSVSFAPPLTPEQQALLERLREAPYEPLKASSPLHLFRENPPWENPADASWGKGRKGKKKNGSAPTRT